MTLRNEPEQEVILYNPDSDDFTCTYDLKGKGQAEEYTIKAKEVGRYPRVLGYHIKKHLVNKLIIKWGKRFTDAAEVKKINDLVEIKV